VIDERLKPVEMLPCMVPNGDIASRLLMERTPSCQVTEPANEVTLRLFQQAAIDDVCQPQSLDCYIKQLHISGHLRQARFGGLLSGGHRPEFSRRLFQLFDSDGTGQQQERFPAQLTEQAPAFAACKKKLFEPP